MAHPMPMDWVTLSDMARTLNTSLPATSYFKTISRPDLRHIRCKPPGNVAGTRRRTYFELEAVIAWLSRTISYFDDDMANDLRSRAATIIAAPQGVL